MSTAADVQRALRALADPERARSSARFFKTGPGQYGEGDRFIGVSVPEQRKCARQFRGLPLKQVLLLLQSEVHEDRLTGLLIMVDAYGRAKRKPEEQERIARAYLDNLDRVNNWDLVDTSAPKIWGNWLLSHERGLLDEQIRSENLWVRRVAMIACQELIKHGSSKEALALAEVVISDQEDLMHKAAGWMLREVGEKIDEALLRRFLRRHATKMPRVMLRYAIEKFPPEERRDWLAAR